MATIDAYPLETGDGYSVRVITHDPYSYRPYIAAATHRGGVALVSLPDDWGGDELGDHIAYLDHADAAPPIIVALAPCAALAQAIGEYLGAAPAHQRHDPASGSSRAPDVVVVPVSAVLAEQIRTRRVAKIRWAVTDGFAMTRAERAAALDGAGQNYGYIWRIYGQDESIAEYYSVTPDLRLLAPADEDDPNSGWISVGISQGTGPEVLAAVAEIGAMDTDAGGYHVRLRLLEQPYCNGRPLSPREVA